MFLFDLLADICGILSSYKALRRFIRDSYIYEARMSPALNGNSAIWRFKHSNAIKIRDGITFDFYTGLPHILLSVWFAWCQVHFIASSPGLFEKSEKRAWYPLFAHALN